MQYSRFISILYLAMFGTLLSMFHSSKAATTATTNSLTAPEQNLAQTVPQDATPQSTEVRRSPNRRRGQKSQINRREGPPPPLPPNYTSLLLLNAAATVQSNLTITQYDHKRNVC